MKNVRIQSSGLHDFAVFEVVNTQDIELSAVEPCVDVVAKLIIEAAFNPITQEEAEREAREVVLRALHESHEVYKIRPYGEPNFEVIAKLKMYCIKVLGWSSSDDTYYLIANDDDSYYRLEAYQALVYKSADIDSFLLSTTQSAVFRHIMGKKIYDECIAAIIKTEAEIAFTKKMGW